MQELEKTARELIWAITEKTLKTLQDKGLLKEPSKLQMLCSIPEMTSLIKKFSAPKYDPCRLFRKGDKVRVKREVHGRAVYIGEDAWEPLDPDEIWAVEEEKETGWVHLKNGCCTADVWHGMLELVTPVEEMEPYYLTESSDFWGVDKDDLEVEAAVFWKKTHPNAKAAAEAERDRLNADYRSAKNGTALNSQFVIRNS